MGRLRRWGAEQYEMLEIRNRSVSSNGSAKISIRLRRKASSKEGAWVAKRDSFRRRLADRAGRPPERVPRQSISSKREDLTSRL